MLWEILTVVDLVAEEASREEGLMTEDQEGRPRCTRQFVTIAEKNAKYLSDQQAASLYFAAIALIEIEVLIQD